jgi:NADH-ubiquinone oxidoreductase chain 5
MLLSSIILPLVAAVTCGCAGRYLGYRGCAYITIGSLALSLSIIVIHLMRGLNDELDCSYLNLYPWLHFASLTVNIDFLFDTLTLTMAFVVIIISLVVHIYSTDYLSNDPHLPRFLMHLSFFTFFMLVLISAGNFVQLFMGWEGVGISSYLLINFWYTRLQANKSALKALFLNRIGDLSLLAALSLIVWSMGSLDFSVIAALTPFLMVPVLNLTLIDVICLFLLGGAIGKSAQLGLHVWLPDAMEGPTPVSALLHAATMVTAGVFLIIRLSFLFEYSPCALILCTLMGALTAFFAATTGLFQNDLKRIIAFSTCSQLGYMFFICGLSNYNVALFHLFNHAFFKALLFLAAGNIIHALRDEQDLRMMGGLSQKLPLTFAFFITASLALMGFPFLSGFYSKDLILEIAGSHFYCGHRFAFFLGVVAALCTAAYSYRLLFYVFLNQASFARSVHLSGIHEPALVIQFWLITLACGSIVTGYLFAPVFIGIGSTFYSVGIYLNPDHVLLLEPDFLPFWQKNLPLLFFFGGPLVMHYLLRHFDYLAEVRVFLFFLLAFFNQKWFFDKIYNTVALWFLKQCYTYFYCFVDKGFIEIFGPTGLTHLFYGNARAFVTYQTGNMGHYVLYILVVFTGLISFYYSFF